MTENHPKSSELMQAQIAAFAAENIDSHYDKVHVFNNLGQLATGKVANVSRVLDEHEYREEFVTDNNRSGRVEPGTEIQVASGEEYMNFLRRVGGKKYESIKKRVEILEAYAGFKKIVAGLRAELEDPSKRREHSAHIGNGSNSDVFLVEKDGKPYAVRIPVGNQIKPDVIDSHVAASALVQNIPHYEHIVAASYEDGVTVAELMPGKEVSETTLDDISHVSDDQLEDFIDSLVVGQERGVIIDPKPSNYFYDPQQGFGIVDLRSSKVADSNSREQTLGDKLGESSFALGNMGIYKKSYETNADETLDYYTEGLQYAKAHKQLLARYRVLVLQKIESIAANDALVLIDQRIQSAENTINTYSNPEWVAQNIAENRGRRLMREEEDRKRKERKATGWEEVAIINDFV